MSVCVSACMYGSPLPAASILHLTPLAMLEPTDLKVNMLSTTCYALTIDFDKAGTH